MRVVVEDQVAGRLLRLLRVAGDAAALEDRLDVADGTRRSCGPLAKRRPVSSFTSHFLPDWSCVLRRQQRRLAASGRRRRSRAGRPRCPRRASASGCGRGSRRSRVRISPGRSWCQVWAMFSTMPFLSSVWKVQATSAGILARKLVSGLPSGSSGCLPPSNLRTGNLAQDAHALAGVVVEAGAAPGAGLAGGGRLQEQDADGVDVVVGVQAGVGALHGPVAAVDQAVVAGRSFAPAIGGGHAARRHRRRTDSSRACTGSTCRPGRTASLRASAASCLPSLASGGRTGGSSMP